MASQAGSISNRLANVLALKKGNFMSNVSQKSPVRKIPLNMTVSDAAAERIAWIFDTFSRICVSFSGGKDSTLLLHLTAQEARQRGKTFSVLFIDWEV